MFYIGIDSFQDPYRFRTQISGTDTPSSELSQTQPNSVISRPFKLDLYSVLISMGDYLISMADYLQNLHGKLSSGNFIKTPYTVKFWTFSRK